MFAKFLSLSLACAISIVPSSSQAQQNNQMPANVRAVIYDRVCAAHKKHSLSMRELLQYTEDWLTSNASFEPLPSDLSTQERKKIKDARKAVIFQQANEMLNEAISDNNCRLRIDSRGHWQ